MADEQTYGERLRESLEEAVAYREGRVTARVHRRQITARAASVPPPAVLDGADVRRLRAELGVSQSVLASFLNVSGATVRAWEQGTRRPSGAALRLMEIARMRPEIVTERVSAPSAPALA